MVIPNDDLSVPAASWIVFTFRGYRAMAPLTTAGAAVTADRIGPFSNVGVRYGFDTFGRLALRRREVVLSLLIAFFAIIQQLPRRAYGTDTLNRPCGGQAQPKPNAN
jgi:hypothetical protein